MIRLEIDPLMFGLTLAVFLMMIVILNSMLYRPMLSYMEDRDRNIKNQIDEAGSTDSDIKSLTAKAEAIINEAKAEAANLRQKVIEDAKMLANSKIEARRAELESEYKAFQKNLEKERESIRNSLLSQTPLYKEALKAKFSQL